MTGSATSPERYGAVAVALHWLIGAALGAQITFGFLLDDIAPRGTPLRGSVINVHKSIGMVLGVLVLLRIAWRLAHPPAAAPSWSRARRLGVAIGHAALYACMVVLPLSGYVASNLSRHGVTWFGHPLAPWGPDSPRWYDALTALHDTTALILVVLVAGHVALALRHRSDRDGVSLWRMRRSGRVRSAIDDPIGL
jgi:cytochrome b561